MPPSHRPRRADGRLSAVGPFGAWLVLCGCLLAALVIWRGRAYWNYSDGVYLLSGREWLDGWAPYGDFAAAQPPGIYVVSAGLLGIHDAASTVRVALAFLDLLTAGLVGWTVWRLARDRRVAVVAGVLAPLPLMTLHETAQLTPETLAAPLVMAAALLAARRSTSAVAGVAGAGMIMLKLAFAVPALAIALASQGRRRALAGLGAAVAVMGGASWLVFGPSLWREIVVAQLASGRASVHTISGLWAQAAWNAVPLLGGCAAALVLRRRSSDPPLLRVLAAAGGAR